MLHNYKKLLLLTYIFRSVYSQQGKKNKQMPNLKKPKHFIVQVWYETLSCFQHGHLEVSRQNQPTHTSLYTFIKPCFLQISVRSKTVSFNQDVTVNARMKSINSRTRLGINKNRTSESHHDPDKGCKDRSNKCQTHDNDRFDDALMWLVALWQRTTAIFRAGRSLNVKGNATVIGSHNPLPLHYESTCIDNLTSAHDQSRSDQINITEAETQRRTMAQIL